MVIVDRVKMSRKLKEFIELLGQSVKSRDDTDIGFYVTWLRRRVALFKHLDTGKSFSFYGSVYSYYNLEFYSFFFFTF